MSYNNGSPLTSTVRVQKNEMQGLNDRLADYINRVRALKNAGSGEYRDAMQQLENELGRVKDAYEAELSRLRRQVEEANKEKVALASKLEHAGQQINDLQSRAASETSRCRKLQDDVNNMAQAIAQKDKEIADLRAACQRLKTELGAVKPNYDKTAKSLEEAQRRAVEEQKKRQEAEEKLKQMQDKLNFDSQRSNQSEQDQADRLRNANQIIASLEAKLKQINKSHGDDVGRQIQALKDANLAELRRYQQETEASLNKNLADLRQQMEKESRERERLAAENATLQDCARHLQSKINELEGQNQGLKQQVGQLQVALDKERKDNRSKEKDMEDKSKEMAHLIMNNQKEFANARDEQANLRAEIDTYKNLLDVEDPRARGGASYSARSVGAAPLPASPLAASQTHQRGASQTARIGANAYAGPKTEYNYAYGKGGNQNNRSLPALNGSQSKTKCGSQQRYTKAY